jgi:hypothetical protein
MRVRPWRPVGVGLLLLLGGACAGAGMSGHTAELQGTMAAARRVAVDPCALVSEAEVEKALSMTIGSSRVRSDDPLARAFAVAPSERVCEYYGVPASAEPSPADDRVSRPSGRRADVRVDEVLAELEAMLDRRDRRVTMARWRADEIASRLRAQELSVSVHPRPLSREQFDALLQRRLRGLKAERGDELTAAVVGQGARFVEEATDRATDVGGVGDAARWYPSLAQLHVLVGDVAFVITSLEQSPMMAGMLFDTTVEPTYDPPPEFVDLARIAAERLASSA